MLMGEARAQREGAKPQKDGAGGGVETERPGHRTLHVACVDRHLCGGP